MFVLHDLFVLITPQTQDMKSGKVWRLGSDKIYQYCVCCVMMLCSPEIHGFAPFRTLGSDGQKAIYRAWGALHFHHYNTISSHDISEEQITRVLRLRAASLGPLELNISFLAVFTS